MFLSTSACHTCKTALPFKGPYSIVKNYPNQLCTLKNKKGEVLKTKQNIANLKPFVAPPQLNEKSEEEMGTENIATEEDVKVIKIQPKVPRTYNPVTGDWQNQKAAQLKLTVKSVHRPQKREYSLTKPTKLERIVGDGNCFFRYVLYVCCTISCRIVLIREFE